MSLKVRLDRITRELAFGELWDGHSLENLAPFFAGEEPAEDIAHGLKRPIVFSFLRSIWFDLADPEE
jgi:hypothetical protein